MTLCIEVASSFLEELAACYQVNPEVEAANTVHSTQPDNTEDHTLNMCIVNTSDLFIFGVLTKSLDASILLNLNYFASALQLGERGIVNVAQFGTKMAML